MTPDCEQKPALLYQQVPGTAPPAQGSSTPRLHSREPSTLPPLPLRTLPAALASLLSAGPGTFHPNLCPQTSHRSPFRRLRPEATPSLPCFTFSVFTCWCLPGRMLAEGLQDLLLAHQCPRPGTWRVLQRHLWTTGTKESAPHLNELALPVWGTAGGASS